MEYYSALKKGRKSCHLQRHMINLEGIILNEINKTEKTNSAWYHLYVELKKKSHTHRNRE